MHTNTHTHFVLPLTYMHMCTHFCIVSHFLSAHLAPSSLLTQPRIHKLKIVPLSVTMPHPKNPHPLSHQCVQMEMCFLIEGVKWTASCRRTRLIRQWMPGETLRQTETVKRGCRGTLKRCSRLTPWPDTGCSLSCTQLSLHSIDGTLIPHPGPPCWSPKSGCSCSCAPRRSIIPVASCPLAFLFISMSVASLAQDPFGNTWFGICHLC